MKPHRPIRVALLFALSLAVLLGGCGPKSTEIPEPVPDLTERDADDFAQQIAGTIASNNGGWWFMIEKSCEIIDGYFPVPIPPPGLASSQRPLAPYRIFNDTTLTRAGVTYNMELRFLNVLQAQTLLPDTSTDQMEAQVSTNYGGSIINPSANVLSTYGFISNLEDTTNTSVINLYPDSDTLEFSGTISDSSFTVVTSNFNAGARVWYHYDNFLDYSLRILKSSLPNATVISGEVTWLIGARPMPDNSGDRTIQVEDVLASARMSFDGTQVALLRVSDSLELVEWRYGVNLQTGAVTKLP